MIKYPVLHHPEDIITTDANTEIVEMKKVLLIEQYPMLCIVIKDLIQDVYPGSQIVVRETIPDSDFDQFDVLVCDLYTSPLQQTQAIEILLARFAKKPMIFLTSWRDSPMEPVVTAQGGLWVSRALQYREIVSLILSYDTQGRPDLHLFDITNDFQSNVRFPGYDKPLTHKQAEVMDLCVGGATSKEIAKELNLSPETVRAHLRQAYVRLQAKCRSEAVKNYIYSKRLADRLESKDQNPNQE